MKIRIIAKPGSKKASVEEKEPGLLRVFVDAPAKENKANIRLLEIVAEYYKVPFSAVRFVSGLRGREKVLEIAD